MAPLDPENSSLASTPAFVTRQFESRDLDQVISIFAEGMSDYPEHKGSPQLAEYVEHSVKTDLGDIHGTYIAPGGNFWVVTPADDSSLVVGMVALEPKPEKEGELRRMSVKSDYRRYGIGRLLISTLEQWATAEGYHKIWLTTGAIMRQACAFYTSMRYTEVDRILIQDEFYAIKFEKALNTV